MPYNTRLRGKNPYNATEVDKKEALASPTKKAKLASPTSPSKKSRKREGDEIDSELKNMKKKLNSQINKLNGVKPSEITPKPNFNKYKKRGVRKVGGKKISKKYNEQKCKNILKNVDANNLKHVRCVVNSEVSLIIKILMNIVDVRKRIDLIKKKINSNKILKKSEWILWYKIK